MTLQTAIHTAATTGTITGATTGATTAATIATTTSPTTTATTTNCICNLYRPVNGTVARRPPLMMHAIPTRGIWLATRVRSGIHFFAINVVKIPVFPLVSIPASYLLFQTQSPLFLSFYSLSFSFSLPLSISLCVAAPPPGSEHIPMGKMLLCSRARQLLGEQVNCWQHTEYTAPQPMIQPEQELREQLHFIGEFILGSLII